MNAASTRSFGEYDALIVVSFGGPEGPDDVLPFLENVLRGKNVPPARMLEVAAHYRHFGGVSPINAQNRQLIAALRREFDERGIGLPIYFGNRNWHPFLPDTLRQMRSDGISRALAFFTSPYSSYSGCRQYRENILQAQEELGPRAPGIDKLRAFHNHPGFIEPMAELARRALDALGPSVRSETHLLFTAHSIPLAMSQGCAYAAQLGEACRLVAERVGGPPWDLVYQSRSGPPAQPWLAPDVGDALRALAGGQTVPRHVLLVPIGFISDHLEVLFDLDTEAREICATLELPMTRVPTVGTHPRFVRMIRELVEERGPANRRAPRWALGDSGPAHDICPEDCCRISETRHA